MLPNIIVDKEPRWTVKRAFFELTLPVFAGIVLSLPVIFATAWFTDDKPQKSVVAKPDQLPLNRKFAVQGQSINGLLYRANITGRQIFNHEDDGWCESAWIGRISNIMSQSGTIVVNDQYLLDDFVATQERGMEDAIKQDLKGVSLQSSSCSIDIVDATVDKIQ